MTNRELARLLLLYPDRVACVADGAMLREVERLRVTECAYLPRAEDGIVARGQIIVIEPCADQSGGCGDRSTVDPYSGLAP